MARIAGRFGRVEPLATARSYLLGLLSNVERKNCWQLAEQAGHTRPGPMQRLLRYARWDADAVRDDLRAYAAEHLGADGAVLVVDETGFLKKGRSSAGVQRQYTGTAGRIENTQVGVFLALATSRGRALIDRRLYLPEHSWSNDPERRTAAGIPETVQFATKPRLAAEMITAALDAGITASWVTGDEAYGQDPQLRAALEARGIGYVMAVACSMRVRINHGRTLVRADTVAGRLPATAWHRHITLAMLALAFLTALAADAAPQRPADTHQPARNRDPITLTVPEIRRLLAAVFNPPAVTAARLLHWSIWRRRHQATAQCSHYRRRTADEPTG
ncbi:IS701 family transposase [Streptomyces sp. NPDC018000]|uniref:IS701 family transposase n=1 Tax=Streptomyces sp. NPDC018000 TaxID=3365028 RepID=UPI0037B44830